MSNSTLSKRYAKAIFDLAIDAKLLEKVDGDFAGLKTTLAESEELRAALSNPVMPKSAQASLMTEILKKIKAQDVTSRFISVLVANGRLSALEEVIESFDVMQQEKNGEVVAEVISAVTLTKKHVTELEKTLGKYLNKKVQVNFTVDEQILGGIIVKIGSKMLDTSVIGRLEKLKTISKNAIASC